MHTTTLLCGGVALLVVLMTLQQTQSSPVQYKSWEEYVKLTNDQFFPNSTDNECSDGSRMKNLCERCAKVAKNEIVFPLCCRRMRNVTEWCDDFLNNKPDEPLLSV